jgi:hypothetical protein
LKNALKAAIKVPSRGVALPDSPKSFVPDEDDVMAIQTNRRIRDYYLFVDESGGFVEKGSKLAEKQGFASQLVGFLAPMSPQVFDEASGIMAGWFGTRGSSEPRVFHANKLAASTVNNAVQKVLPKLLERGWQPVRLVNLEHVRYREGDRISNYTNMVAELALRLFQEKSKGSDDRTIIHFQGDIVSLAEKDLRGFAPTIPKRDYQLRFDEYLSFAAVRRGLAREQLKWDLRSVKLKNAKVEPVLQICDLLSYASHADYKHCSRQTKQLLREAFGPFDQTMETLDLIERIDRLIAEQTFGIALQILAEALYNADEPSRYPREGANNRVGQITDRLVQIGVRGRDPHLAVLVGWLDQLIGQQRLYDGGYSIANWLVDNLSVPLREQLRHFAEDHTVNWFEYSLRRWALTAANHGGALRDAEEQLVAMRRLEPLLARQWERIPLLIDGFIAQAVHQTDCFAHDKVADNMEWIAEALKLQSESLQKLMPEALSEPISYDARGKALGTRVQALILRGFKDESNIESARKVSDDAIAEFSSIDDKARQYQYRCHLETIAGDFPAARRFLSMSIMKSERASKESSHQEISDRIWAVIKNLPQGSDGNYRFWLQHWLRMGALAYLRGDAREQTEFTGALKRTKVLNSSWCIGEETSWPAHGILRSVAVIQASLNDTASATETLRCMQSITPFDENHLVIAVIALAAQLEVAALFMGTPTATALLDGDTNRIQNIKGILDGLFKGSLDLFPEMKRLLIRWRESVSRIRDGQVPQGRIREMLINLASEIRY